MLKKQRWTTLVISTQNWSILAKFAKKNPAKSAVFYWLFLGEVSPRNFPWNRPIFLRICPWKSFEIWLFPLISREIGRFFCEICPWKSRKILLFFPRNIRSPVHSINHHPADKVQGNQLQHAKKVVSDGQGLMDFAIWLVNSVLDLPDGRVMFFEEFK